MKLSIEERALVVEALAKLAQIYEHYISAPEVDSMNKRQADACRNLKERFIKEQL